MVEVVEVVEIASGEEKKKLLANLQERVNKLFVNVFTKSFATSLCF